VQIIRNLKSKMPALAATIGNFDGVHLGHLHIINEVKKIAKEKNLASAILTFEPHPIAFFHANKKENFRLTSIAQKLKIFRDAKIDYAIILPFDKKFSEISANDFVEKILREALNIKHLTIGYDFTFGKNREGNFKLLEELKMNLSEISPIKNNELTCSSTSIRRFIADGKIVEANKILGRNFAVEGIVNEGRKLASQLGFPTLNLSAKPQIIQPKFGVYKTEIFVPSLNKKFPSITNFGIKPTLGGDAQPLFETHIPNFSQNLYGKKICVEFIDFIRDEKKFASLDELKNQIAADINSLIS